MKKTIAAIAVALGLAITAAPAYGATPVPTAEECQPWLDYQHGIDQQVIDRGAADVEYLWARVNAADVTIFQQKAQIGGMRIRLLNKNWRLDRQHRKNRHLRAEIRHLRAQLADAS